MQWCERCLAGARRGHEHGVAELQGRGDIRQDGLDGEFCFKHGFAAPCSIPYKRDSRMGVL